MTSSSAASPTRYVVRDIEPGDAAAWARLYTGYRTFYAQPVDAQAVATTWGWMIGREHGLRGLVAVSPAGEPVALANLRTFARPSVAKTGLYLDDLFTAPEARGTGAAGALLERAAAIAAELGATGVRWITAPDNATARRLYDAHATAAPWVTYDMAPASATDVR